jgi:hypothetical protein
MLRRSALLLPLAAALLLPACGEDTGTLPDVSRAGLQVVVDPTPVAGVQNPLTGSVAANYRIRITETNGLGGKLIFVSSQIFDPQTGLQVAGSYFDSTDLVVFVGSDRLDPGATVEVPQNPAYVLPDFRTEAQLTVNVQLKDDRSNVVNQSVLVKIE